MTRENLSRVDKKYEVECFKCGKKVLVTGAELEAMSRGWLYICNDCAKQNPEDDNNKTGLTFRKRRLKKNIARIWCRFCDRTLFAQEWYETENGISCCAECYDMLKGDENERGE